MDIEYMELITARGDDECEKYMCFKNTILDLRGKKMGKKRGKKITTWLKLA